MERKLKGFLVDVVEGEAKPYTLVSNGDELEKLYKLLNCSMIEAPDYEIGGKYYTFICDEEYWMTHDEDDLNYNDVSAIRESGNKYSIPVWGSIFIISADADEEGNFMSLTDKDIENIQNHIEVFRNHKVVVVD